MQVTRKLYLIGKELKCNQHEPIICVLPQEIDIYRTICGHIVGILFLTAGKQIVTMLLKQENNKRDRSIALTTSKLNLK